MKKRVIFLTIAFALSALAIFTSTRTGSDHNVLGGNFINWINVTFFSSSLSEMEKTAITGASAKLFGHFGLFLLTGLFFLLGINTFSWSIKKKAIVVFAYGFLLSCAGEFVQLFSADRSATFYDVLIDFGGYSFAPLIYFLRH